MQCKMARFVIVAMVALLVVNLVLQASGQDFYEVDMKEAIKDKILFGYSFLNLTQTTILDCFKHCVQHCRCLAFQMCQNTNCQLLSSNRNLSFSRSQAMLGCTYYDLLPRQPGQLGRCDGGINCCITSSPCRNGGTCQLSSFQHHTKRFKCRCPKGYTGERCDVAIKSCRSYALKSNTPGIYQIFDAQMKLFDVFCDFDKNSSMAWTLIQSYQRQHSTGDGCKWSFVFNKPRNPEHPSWNLYRLPKSKMESIQQDSSKWRMTCNYESAGVVFTDYVRCSNAQVDIMTINGNFCVKLEYIDIRGTNCSNCTAYMIQSHNRAHYAYVLPLHFEPYWGLHCDLKVENSMGCQYRRGEDSFGLYDCVNENHRCSALPNATTQTWFGG